MGSIATRALSFGPESDEDSSRWWPYAVHGLVAVAAGALLLAAPDRTLLLVGLAAGVYLIVAGIVGIARAFTTPGMLAMERAIPAVVGVVAILAGIVVLIRPASSVFALALAAGIYLIVAGLSAGVAALSGSDNWALDALRAFIGLSAGVLLLTVPEISIKAFAVILGIYLVVRGLIEIGASTIVALRG
ncbi:MAG: HdeD family acid-resistance protein [Solirubrobacterales bacterium]